MGSVTKAGVLCHNPNPKQPTQTAY